MKRYLAFLAVLLPMHLSAQQVDTSSVDPDKYVPELGYFQKAHRDASDPRFLITDAEKNFSIGVGGMVHVNAFYDFGGSMPGYLFSPGTLSVPVDKARHFGYTITGSDVYVKAKSQKGKLKLTAYLELTGAEVSETDYVFLNMAYVSINGLTIGKTYSFFMDLEAGPLTVDLQGPNTQISSTHNLLGYTQPIGKHWTVAAALESPSSVSKIYQDYQFSYNYNRYPDLAAHFKYRGEKGHIQAGMLLREISYWVSKEGFTTVDKGTAKRSSGFGVSLSGNFNPTEKLSFSAQTMYGKGVSNYIQDLASLQLDFGMEDRLDSDGYVTLSPVSSFGGYVSASYSFTPSLRSSVVYGFCGLDNNGLYTADTFRKSDYLAANIFYFFSPYCFIGMEYLYGRKVIYALPGADDRGYANRLNACVCYRF